MPKNSLLQILADWGDVIAVNKPAGWLSVPGRGKKEGVPVMSHILGQNLRGSTPRGKDPDLYIVHRLDEGTSGAMIFARTAQAHKDLNGLFESSNVKKTYWCIVQGVPKDQLISAPLFKLPSKRIKSVVDPKGKPSQTRITIKGTNNGFSLVEATPVTGRSHQIRVHLSHIGCPLVGDPLYGGPPEIHGLHWTFPLLHCRQLQFEWPPGEIRMVHSPPGDEFLKALETLGFSDGCQPTL